MSGTRLKPKVNCPQIDISKELNNVCLDLIQSDTAITLDWTSENRSLFTFLKSKEVLEESRVQGDMFRLTGLYVSFGTQVFEKIDHSSKALVHLFLKQLTTKYKILEDPKVRVPRMRVTDIIRHFPFYVAEHLHLERGETIGERNELPRCLAFSGGLHLIPVDPEWDNLVLIWKVWRATFSNDELDGCAKKRYILIDYIPIDNSKRGEIMAHFDIEKPTIEQGLKAISDVVGGCLYEHYYATGLNPFKTNFLCYEYDIANYYQMHTYEMFDFEASEQSFSEASGVSIEESS